MKTVSNNLYDYVHFAQHYVESNNNKICNHIYAINMQKKNIQDMCNFIMMSRQKIVIITNDTIE